ncbi:putative helicase mov-10-B.1 [Lepisosteus oculatus]|uniref:putative helicase mov-10-B.1 n=1 Tax=Lepisosteus oculatus TaxID=7918 RepID=UPI003716E206
MPTVRENMITGLDFMDFLEETNRSSKTDREELKGIYNSEFRNRNGERQPSFSRIVYALVKHRKAKLIRGQLCFNTQVRVFYGDQWSRPPQQPGAAPMPIPNGAPLGSSPASGLGQVPGRKKLARALLQLLKQNRSAFIADKAGIVITSDHESTDNKITFKVSPNEPYHLHFYIENKGEDPVQFTLYTPLHRMRFFSFVDEQRVTRACPLLLNPGDRYEIQVQCQVSHFGFFPVTVAFEFRPHGVANSKPFYIIRYLAAVANSSLAEQLGPSSPYRPYQRAIRRPVTIQVEEGVPPESNTVQQLKQVVFCAPYNYPSYLKNLARERLEDSDRLFPTDRNQLLSVRALLEPSLNFENYSKRFQLLLHLEEIQMEVDIKKYDMEGQTMTEDPQNKKLLILHVPGVAENRPSVLRGDHLLVSKSDDHVEPITKYKGYVYKVELERVKLGFSQKLLHMFIPNMKFDVSFTFNRMPLKLQHRAVEMANKNGLGKVLFPTASEAPDQNLPDLRARLFDQNLESNPEQYRAVQCIVAGVSKPAPFLVFGPPGTGKTVTIVEAIKQVHRLDPSSHVLACAPSNSASDLLCQRLIRHIDHHQVYRMYASSRDPNSLPIDLLNCCNWNPTRDCYVNPSKEELMKFRIIVTTVVTAGWLVSGGIPPGHFTHLFVDEAGHAVEPECIIGMAGLLDGHRGQLVLAGDPKQLGPILRSPLAITHGLGVSLLERLMTTNPLYQKNVNTGQYNGIFVTKLLRNYRSHPAILKIPNELFYDGELQVFADEILRSTYCNWEHLPEQGFPIIFHGVLGKDDREGNSPSFFNVAEMDIVIFYLKKLLPIRGKKGTTIISPKDIGIIAPYRKQVEKIKKAIYSVDQDLKNLNDIKELKVGSVEEFQGQERRVIIVSAVRSSLTYVKMDEDFSLGFLKNEKRFNVAMTRAKALLIVVGNPVILSKDPTWGRFLRYCTSERGYTGYDFSNDEGEDELMTRLASLDLSAESPVVSEESVVQQQLEPEWRSDM